VKIDTPKEIACLDRAAIWEGLIGWCEEMEREFEAEVGRSGADPAVMMSSLSDPGGTPALKRPKNRQFKPGWYDPKTMTRAVARDLGLI
jgi:hypothetical protein